MTDRPVVLSTEQVAARLGVVRTSLLKARWRNALPLFRVGPIFCLFESDLEAAIASGNLPVRRGRVPKERLSHRRVAELRAAVDAGLSLPAIAAQFDVSRQRAAQMLVETELHDLWKIARAKAVHAEVERRVIARRPPAVQDLIREALALGYAVGTASGRLSVTVDGLELRVARPIHAKRLPAHSAEHPGYYPFQCWVTAALYVVVFPEGGRLFRLPPHPVGAKHNHEYMRCDDPRVAFRERWPSRKSLRAAARAVRAAEKCSAGKKCGAPRLGSDPAASDTASMSDTSAGKAA